MTAPGGPILDRVLIAQISDCHIRDHVGLFGDLVDTSESLRRVVAHLNSLRPVPDVVLATGDLTDDGTDAQYAVLMDILDGLGPRLLPLPGNHDEGPAFRSAFAEALPGGVADGHCSYVVDDYPVRLVGLDTSADGRHDADFTRELEGWLEAALGRAPDRPTMVFTHFPPFATGLAFMDLAGMAGAERMRAVLERHPQVRMLVAGHIHRPIQTAIGTMLVSVCPSTGNQLGLELDPGRGSAVDEPPGFQLHRWDGERFVTHTGVAWEGDRMDLTGFVAEVHRRAEAGEGFPKHRA